ncbi:MAG: GyrI-like domain-containing protein [Victivallaceae bacterium]|nr:GyrI-like domain-containing protein [Victivallaceae bacterium]
MNYKIEILPEFTVLASVRAFHAESAKSEIPKFWQEYYQRGNGKIACGQFGICFGGKPDGLFLYGIGNRCEVEQKPDGATVCHVFNCPDRTQIPDGFEVCTIPAQTWMKVEARGALPKSIQNTYPVIEKEWPQGWERVCGMDI